MPRLHLKKYKHTFNEVCKCLNELYMCRISSVEITQRSATISRDNLNFTSVYESQTMGN